MWDLLFWLDVDAWLAPAAAAFTVFVVFTVTIMRRQRARQIRRALEIERRLHS